MKRGIEKAFGSWLIFLALVNMILVSVPEKVLALGEGNANLALLPAFQTVGVNSSFDVAIQVQANGESVDGVAVRLDFDPAKLGVNSLTPVTRWNGKTAIVLPVTSLDNVTGQVNFTAGILGDTATGSFSVATVNFIARAATANTSIGFHFSQPPSRNTNITGGGKSILGAATGASLTTAGASLTGSQLVSIAVTPPNPSIAAGLTQQFRARGTYANQSSVDISDAVSWTSSNQAIATIQTTGKANSGLLTGLAAGTTTITAALGTISATATITVTRIEEKLVTSPPEPKTVTTTTTPTPPGAAPGTIATSGEPTTTNAPPSAQVVPAASPATTGAPQPPPPATTAIFNWWFFGGITAGVLILVLVSYLLLRRRV